MGSFRATQKLSFRELAEKPRYTGCIHRAADIRTIALCRTV